MFKKFLLSVCRELFPCDETVTPPVCICQNEAPVMDGGTCRKGILGDPCNAAVHCKTTLDCNALQKKCQCVMPTPDWNTQLKICEGKGTHGAPCTVIRDCEPGKNLFCLNNKCSCSSSDFQWIDGECQGKPGEKTFGQPCSSKNECDSRKNLTCDSSKVCQCISQNYIRKGDSCGLTGSINATCQTDFECVITQALFCVNNTCQCGSRFEWNKVTVSCKRIPPRTINGSCIDSDDCDNRQSLSCIGGKCSCRRKHVWRPAKTICERVFQSINGSCDDSSDCISNQRLVCSNLRKCICREGLQWKRSNLACEKIPKKTFNGPCDGDDECITERHLKCLNNKCGCASDLVWHEAICKSKESQTGCDPLLHPNECTTKALECDEKERVCRCPDRHDFSPSTQSCKLVAGELCYLNKTLEHDLCASQQCDPNSNTCACPETEGVKETWSSEPGVGCVTDYYQLPCAGANDECRSSKFNSRRKGLVCQDQKCQCQTGLTYYKGYCITANVLHWMRCDPEGINPTCKVEGGTSLTCKDVGVKDFKCVCLPRELTVRGRNQPVSLHWNEELNICDLKPNGEPCNGPHECRISYCRGTCQPPLTEQAKNVRRSGAPKITHFTFLIVLNVMVYPKPIRF